MFSYFKTNEEEFHNQTTVHYITDEEFRKQIKAQFWEPNRRVKIVGFAVRHNWRRYLCPHFGPRLGNLMFLYASYYGIAYHYNVTLVLDQRDPIYRSFIGVPKSTINKHKACNGSFYSLRQPRPRYYEHFKVPMYGNIRVSGYLQSWKFFSDSFPDIKKQFRWKPSIKIKARNIVSVLVNKTLPGIPRLSITTVGIHVRRGDYVREGRPTADRQYFKDAMVYFTQRYGHVVFLVATTLDAESKNWTLTNVINDCANCVFTGFNDRFVDMAILSMLDHIVISTGTYGWWAAFLNRGTVIHYDWIPQHHPKFNRDDYILPYWIGIQPSNYTSF